MSEWEGRSQPEPSVRPKRPGKLQRNDLLAPRVRAKGGEVIRLVLFISLVLVASGGTATSQPASGSPAKPTPASTPIPLAKVPLEAQSALASLQ
jgi:hypothetical protein